MREFIHASHRTIVTCKDHVEPMPVAQSKTHLLANVYLGSFQNQLNNGPQVTGVKGVSVIYR